VIAVLVAAMQLLTALLGLLCFRRK
jgi:hypothetical protein